MKDKLTTLRFLIQGGVLIVLGFRWGEGRGGSGGEKGGGGQKFSGKIISGGSFLGREGEVGIGSEILEI